MGTAMFEIKSVPTFRDLHGRFTKAEQVLLKERQEGIRGEAVRFVGLAREEAPKRTGEFARGITYRTFTSGDAVGFRAYTPQPLGTWIVKGTKAHTIMPIHAKTLHFWIGSKEIFTRKVHHPGTKANKFTGRAYRRWLPGAKTMLHRISKAYIRTIVGSK